TGYIVFTKFYNLSVVCNRLIKEGNLQVIQDSIPELRSEMTILVDSINKLNEMKNRYEAKSDQ
nr:hypothetical protein [Spirochaetaceae bacterium]